MTQERAVGAQSRAADLIKRKGAFFAYLALLIVMAATFIFWGMGWL